MQKDITVTLLFAPEVADAEACQIVETFAQMFAESIGREMTYTDVPLADYVIVHDTNTENA